MGLKTEQKEMASWSPLAQKYKEVMWLYGYESLENSGLEQFAKDKAYYKIVYTLPKTWKYQQGTSLVNATSKKTVYVKKYSRQTMHTQPWEKRDFDPEEAMEVTFDKRKFFTHANSISIQKRANTAFNSVHIL